jgi:hypothetical protein
MTNSLFFILQVMVDMTRWRRCKSMSWDHVRFGYIRMVLNVAAADHVGFSCMRGLVMVILYLIISLFRYSVVEGGSLITSRG